VSTYIKFLVLFVIIVIPVYLVAVAVGKARKKKMQSALEDEPVAELQAKARALLSPGGRSGIVFTYRVTASQYGKKAEALTESLLERTFSQKDDLEANHRFLAEHYAGLLDLLLDFLVANWSWAEPSDKPGNARFQVFYEEPAAAGVVRRFPRAKNELAAGAISQTLEWLEGLARRQNELLGIWAPGEEALRAVPKWDAAVFASRDHTRTGGMLHQSLIEISCPPAVLRIEIERLRPRPSAPTA